MNWRIRKRERLDGLQSLLFDCAAASVLDVGCNRGLVSYELAAHGAILVHGCDNSPRAIETARHLFDDVPGVTSQFEVLDVSQGRQVFEVFRRSQPYDIVLLLGVYHKLKRVMAADDLRTLLAYLGNRASQYFAWNGSAEHYDEVAAVLDLDLNLWHRQTLIGQEVAIWRTV